MVRDRAVRVFKNILKMVGIFVAFLAFAAAITISSTLSGIFDPTHHNSFAVSIFILAVAVVARLTDGYIYGVVASVVGVFLVNYALTFPFFEFNMSIAGYPLTFAAMLLVSLLVSALTTQIKKQNQLQLEVEREKTRANLLRSVSHDIRTPLTSILGASSVLLENESLPPADREDLLREINKDARWLIRLTENILSVTKFSGDGVVLKKEAEALEEILGSAIRKFRKGDGSMPITVTKPEKILLVSMDATLIEQVLINLFENVLEHGETATRIVVNVACEKGRVWIRVEDDGVGISADMLRHVFDGRAISITRSHSDDRRNMGIGLSVCQAIVRAHGGEIFAYNSPQGGAGIRFWLPYEEEDADAQCA